MFFGENYLACGSSSGSLSVFNLDDVLREQRGSGGGTSSPDPSPRPSLVVPDAHRGAVYSVIAFTLQGSEMLCSAGEDGRSVLWRASDLIAAANAGRLVQAMHTVYKTAADVSKAAEKSIIEANKAEELAREIRRQAKGAAKNAAEAAISAAFTVIEVKIIFFSLRLSRIY